MKNNDVYCDNCKKKMNHESARPIYGLTLSSRRCDTNSSGIYQAISVHPFIDREMDFCSIDCIYSWASQKLSGYYKQENLRKELYDYTSEDLGEGVLVVDPPQGHRYGFPKECPKEREKDINNRLVEEGYPTKEIEGYGDLFHCRFWRKPKK